jgi:hypothetical protein
VNAAAAAAVEQANAAAAAFNGLRYRQQFNL